MGFKVFELHAVMTVVILPFGKVATVVFTLRQIVQCKTSLSLGVVYKHISFHITLPYLVDIVLGVRRHIGFVLRDSVTDVIKILQVLQRAILDKLALHCPDALVKQLGVFFVVAETNERSHPLGGLLSSSISERWAILGR